MGWLRSGALLAFDAGSLSGAALRRTLSGRRLERLRLIPLEPETIVPSPLEPNLRRPEAVGLALGQLVREIGITAASATLILPDGVARLALLEPPAGVEAAAEPGAGRDGQPGHDRRVPGCTGRHLLRARTWGEQSGRGHSVE